MYYKSEIRVNKFINELQFTCKDNRKSHKTVLAFYKINFQENTILNQLFKNLFTRLNSLFKNA